MITGKLDNPRPFGRFVLTAKIASGGMATVYHAEVPSDDPLHGRPIALKVLHDHLSENDEFIRMFRDEARVVRDLDHPGVVKVFELGECEGSHYIAMEFVEGRDLAQLLVALRANGQVMSAGPAFEILRQTLTALSYVHSFKARNGRPAGIVHRDISPQNLLISKQPLVKITDFGIARGTHRSDRTKTGTVKGKMHYMAPEQAAGAVVDARADLYAVGAVAFEMLTGQPLFGPGSTEVLHKRAITGQIEFGSKFKAQPDDVKAWLEKSLARDPADRFHSADAMLAAMEQLGKASKSQYKPENLLRILELPEARRSKQREQRLFLDPEAGTGRVATGGLIQQPVKPISRLMQVPAGAHPEIDAGERSKRLEGRKVDWDAPEPELRPITGVREAGQRQGRDRIDLLPAERAVGKSYRPEGEVRPQAHARKAESAHVEALQPSSFKRPQPVQEPVLAPPPVAEKKAAQRSEARGAKSAKVSRAEAAEQKGMALAGTAAWLCAALVLFAVVLELTGTQVQLPEVDDQMVAGLFDEEGPKSDAAAVSAPARPVGLLEERAAPELRQVEGMAEEKQPDDPTGTTAQADEPEDPQVAERRAKKLVEANAERWLWAGKPLERVEKPDLPKKVVKAKPQAVEADLPVKKPAPAAPEKVLVGAQAAAPIVPRPVVKPAVAPQAAAKPVAKPAQAVAKPVQAAAKPAQAGPGVGKPSSKVPVASAGAAKPSSKVPVANPSAAKPSGKVPVASAGAGKPSAKAPVANQGAGKPSAKAPVVAAGAKKGSANAVAKPAPGKPAPAVRKPATPAKPAAAAPAKPAAGAKRPAAAPTGKPAPGAKPSSAAKGSPVAKPSGAAQNRAAAARPR